MSTPKAYNSEKMIETLLACELGPAGLFDQRVTLEMVFDEWAAEYAGQSIPCREWAGKLADAILALDAPAQDVILRHNVAKINIGLRLQEIDLSAWRDWKP